MHNADLLNRYALALALVPDRDAAADLFMDTTTEPDLRQRAAAWRRKHGFPEADDPAELPALSAEDREYALHLAQRGRSRRRRRTLGLVGLGILIAALVAAWGGWAAQSALTDPLPEWAADPVFAGTPTDKDTKNQVTFRVFRTEATPGGLTVWWSAEGPGTIKNWKSLKPVVRMPTGQEAATDIEPALTETARIGRERVLGRSTFSVYTMIRDYLYVRLDKAGDREVGAVVAPAIHRTAQDPKAVVYQLPAAPQDVQAPYPPVEIRVGETYTAIIYKNNLGWNASLRLGTLLADNEPVRFRGAYSMSGSQIAEFFDLPGPGTVRLEVRSIQPWSRQLPVTVSLPGQVTPEVTMEQLGTGATVVMKFGAPGALMGWSSGTVEDEQGRSYALAFASSVTEDQATFNVINMPPGTRLVRASFRVSLQAPAPSFAVDLKK